MPLLSDMDAAKEQRPPRCLVPTVSRSNFIQGLDYERSLHRMRAQRNKTAPKENTAHQESSGRGKRKRTVRPPSFFILGG